jgi:hypothetical protein
MRVGGETDPSQPFNPSVFSRAVVPVQRPVAAPGTMMVPVLPLWKICHEVDLAER